MGNGFKIDQRAFDSQNLLIILKKKKSKSSLRKHSNPHQVPLRFDKRVQMDNQLIGKTTSPFRGTHRRSRHIKPVDPYEAMRHVKRRMKVGNELAKIRGQ